MHDKPAETIHYGSTPGTTASRDGWIENKNKNTIGEGCSSREQPYLAEAEVLMRVVSSKLGTERETA